MNMKHLKYFLDVAHTCNLTRSASRLGVSQPALTRAMRSIEEELGISLFAREGRGIALTPEGKALEQGFARVEAEYEAAIAEACGMASAAAAVTCVHLGAASRVTIDAIADWVSGNPEARFELEREPGGLSASPDISVSGHAMPDSVRHASFKERIMLACPLHAMEAAGLPDAPVAPSSLSSMKLIELADTSGFRRACDAACDACSVHPEIVLESDSPEVVRKAISLGLGVGFWSEFSWGDPGSGVALVPIDDARFTREVCISLSARGIEKACARDFYAFLNERMRGIFAGRG